MQKSAAWIGLAAIALTGCITIRGQVEVREPDRETKRLRHIVLLSFKDGTTPYEMQQVERAARGLPEAIPQIQDFEWGLEMSGRGLNKGFTHAMVFTFDNEKTRDAYRAHPSHKAFVRLAEPHLEELFVFDYWADPD